MQKSKPNYVPHWKEVFIFKDGVFDAATSFKNLGYAESEYEKLGNEGTYYSITPIFKPAFSVVVEDSPEEKHTNADLYKNFIWITSEKTPIFSFYKNGEKKITPTTNFKEIYFFIKNNPKINRLHLENITYFSKLSLELGARATIILGQNGSGKTSILRALALALVANENTQDKLSVQSQSSKLNNLLKINSQNEKKNNPIGKIELFQYEDENVVFKKRIQVSPNAVISKTFGAIKIEKILEGDYQLVTSKEWYFNQLILGFSQIQTQKNSDANYYEQVYYYPSDFRDIENLLYNYPMDILDGLEYWIWALDADSRKKETHNKNKKNALKKLFDTISGIIGTQIEFYTSEATTKQISVKILNLEQPDNTEIVPFQLLSQGFKNVFAWAGHLVRRMAEAKNYARDFHTQPAIVMIDEIDTYLHPKWQKNILKALLEHFPNTQFIVTTHSPFVANYIPPQTVAPEDLRVYMLGEKDAPPRLLNKLYGRDIANIFWDMEMPERPVEVAKDIEQIFQQLEIVSSRADLNKTKKLIQTLKTILPAEDTVFVSIAYALAEAEWVLSNRSKQTPKEDAKDS